MGLDVRINISHSKWQTPDEAVRDRVLIATKFGFRIDPRYDPRGIQGSPVLDSRPEHIKEAVVASESPRHWVVLGSDAQRRIGAKRDMLRAELEAGADTGRSTDHPGSAKAIP